MKSSQLYRYLVDIDRDIVQRKVYYDSTNFRFHEGSTDYLIIKINEGLIDILYIHHSLS